MGVAVVWGGSYLAAKELLDSMPVSALIALRFAVAAFALLAIYAVRNIFSSKHAPASLATLRVGLITGLTMACVLFLETAGVGLTTASNAGVIISLAIVFTPIFEAIASRNWLPAPYFVATAVALVGVVLLMSGGGFRTPNAGDLLMLAAALVRAIHVTLLSTLTRKERHDPILLTLVQASLCALAGIAVNPEAPLRAAATLTPSSMWGLLYLGLGAGVFAFLVQLWGIQRTSAARASLLMGTEPIWAALIGVVIAKEALGWAGAAGMVLIVAACFVGQRIELRSRTGSKQLQVECLS